MGIYVFFTIIPTLNLPILHQIIVASLLRRAPPIRSELNRPLGFPPVPAVNKKRLLLSLIRKESILCPEASSCASTPLLPSPPTNANLVLKGWLEGDRLIPIKKRRGSFGKKMNHDVEEDNEMVEETMKPKPTKRNDKCVAKQEVISATCPKKNNKNGKRGNVIMVGSRCSRVNGRGWRCCQQTLVGYSLCEHHLGKGRLRSMTSFRGRAQKVAPKEQAITKEMISIDNQELEDDDDDEEEEEEELKGWEEESKSSVEGMKKFSKKKKLGVVKARSLSSLLSQMGS